MSYLFWFLLLSPWEKKIPGLMLCHGNFLFKLKESHAPENVSKPSVICMLHAMNRCLWWRFVIESRCESRFLMEHHLLLVAVEFVTSKVGHNGWRQAGRALAFCPLFFMGEIYKSKSFRNEARISLWPSAILFSNPGEFWMWVFSLRQEFEILSHKELV